MNSEKEKVNPDESEGANVNEHSLRGLPPFACTSLVCPGLESRFLPSTSRAGGQFRAEIRCMRMATATAVTAALDGSFNVV